MEGQAEVQVHGTVVSGRTLVECTVCGPVGVTDAPLAQAISWHFTDHMVESITDRSNR